MFTLDIKMKRLNAASAKIFLISNLLNFGNQLSWETKTRGETHNPYLWSCLLDTEAEADAYLAKLSLYALTAQKISSISTPGKFRVGISLNSMDDYSDERINIAKIYCKKLNSLILLLQLLVKKSEINWMTVCYLHDSQTHIPLLAIQYPGVYVSLFNPTAKYNEKCVPVIQNMLQQLFDRAKIDENKITEFRELLQACLYHCIQKECSYAMLDYPIVPWLLNMADIAIKKHINFVSPRFFTKTPIQLPTEIALAIVQVGGLAYKDVSNLFLALQIKEGESEQLNKVRRISN